MAQLTASKKQKLLSALKSYRKKYLVGKYSELDESATRLMVNSFLTDVLGFASLDEVKTEYMIRGTYADYIVQMKGKRYFIVEVKSFGLELSQKHLRQAVNYAANEGIEWALLTNARRFDFYKILFDKPIDACKVFSIDLADESMIKAHADQLQYLTRTMLPTKGLESLWQRFSALEPRNVGRLLLAKPVVNFLRRELKRSYKTKLGDDEIKRIITRIIEEPVESRKPSKPRKSKARRPRTTRPEPPEIPVGS